MLARRSTILQTSGIPIDLPRLVPSFSSKGSPLYVDENNKKRYEVEWAYNEMTPFIKKSILVSAYDIKHGHIRKAKEKFKDKELIFIEVTNYR